MEDVLSRVFMVEGCKTQKHFVITEGFIRRGSLIYRLELSQLHSQEVTDVAIPSRRVGSFR